MQNPQIFLDRGCLKVSQEQRQIRLFLLVGGMFLFPSIWQGLAQCTDWGFGPDIPENWLMIGSRIVGGLVLFFGFLHWRDVSFRFKRYHQFKEQGHCHTTFLDITDRYQYLQGEPSGNPTDSIYFVTANGVSWQLNESLSFLFRFLEPGTRIRAAVIDGTDEREIVDAEILLQALPPLRREEEMVTQKFVSDLTVLGSKAGKMICKSAGLIPSIKYYLVVKGSPKQVSAAEFFSIPLYS